MGWARFDDKRHANPKILAGGLEANGLDANGITYAAANETDGFIPDAALPVLCVGARNPRRIAQRLVDVERWARDEDRGGFWIHDYLEYNQSRAEADKKRQAERERKAAGRSRQGRDDRGRITSARSPDGSGEDSERTPAGSDTDSGRIPTGVPPVPTRPDPIDDSRLVVTNGGRGSPGSESGDFNEATLGLATWFVEGMDQTGWSERRRAKVLDEVRRVVSHCQAFLDDQPIEEAIGRCRELEQRPTSAKYLLTTVRRWAAEHDVAIPELGS